MTDIEHALRRILKEVLEPIEPRRSLPLATVGRAKARRAVSVGLAGTTLLVVLAIASWGLLVLAKEASETPARRPVGPSETSDPSTTQVPVEPIVALATEDGAMWAITCDRRCSDDGRNSEGRAVRLDPESGAVKSSTPIPAPSGIAIGGGAVWVISFWDGTVTRIDPSTGAVEATVDLKLPTEIAPGDDAFLPAHVTAGDGAVWISTGRGAVARIAPETNQVAALVDVPGGTTGPVVAGEGAVWVAENVLGVHRVDPARDRVVDEIVIEEGRMRLAVDEVAVGRGAVWVGGTWAEGSAPDSPGHIEYTSTDDQAVYRIDPNTNIPTPVNVEADHGPIAFGEGSLWVTSHANRELAEVDPNSLEVTRTLELGPGEWLLDVGGGAVWVVDGQGRVRGIQLGE